MSMTFASVLYAIWIFSNGLTSLALKNEDLRDHLSYNAVICVVIICSILVGFGSSLVWVAQGKYLSDCSLVCQDKKGRYQSIFWFFTFSSFLFSSLMGSFILGKYAQEYLFFVSTFICLVSTIMFYFLPDIKQLPIEFTN